MKPSLTPFFSRSPPGTGAQAMTADMSTSLKVVSIAASCCAETRRSAMRWRSGESLRRVWRSPRGRGAAGAGAGCLRPRRPAPASAAAALPVLRAARRRRFCAGLGRRRPAVGAGAATRRQRVRPWAPAAGAALRRRRSTAPAGRRRGLRVDHRDHLADLHLGAGGDLERDPSGGFRGALGGDLVGLQLEERLVLLDDVAVGDVPLGEDAGVDGFAHRGHFDFEKRHGIRGNVQGWLEGGLDRLKR